MKKEIYNIIYIISVMLFAPLISGCDNSTKTPRHLSVEGGAFMLDSSLFTIASAELGYARHPREYWDTRLKQVKELGVNTIMVRVPWMLHEAEQGVFDFSGQNDVREFCRLADDNGLLVWLHIGPYTDEHADMGGMPWWLLKDKNMKCRTLYKPFMDNVGCFFRKVAAELADMQLSKGGPIALIQIEEPVALSGNVREYLGTLCDSVRAAGFNDTQLTIASHKENLHMMPKNGAIIALVLNEEVNALEKFTGIRKRDANAPLLCYDISRSCIHSWGSDYMPRNLNKVFLRVFEVFEGLGSVNFSAAVGGTSFGHLAGAALSAGKFVPYSTSYDNSALINEAGYINEDYNKFATAFWRSATHLDNSPIRYNVAPLTNLPTIMFDSVSPLYDNLPTPVLSDKLLTFEECGIGYGAVLYETYVSDIPDGAHLIVKGIRDNLQIFLNDDFLASVSRVDSDTFDVLLPTMQQGARLRLLVDALGRVGNIAGYKDYKGLVGSVELVLPDGKTVSISDWKHYPLSADYSHFLSAKYLPIASNKVPGCYKATFKKVNDGDFFLYMGSWGRGEVWLNGYSLGRYWNIGPQQTLYVPGCWLKDDNNELVILDWVGPEQPFVEGYKTCVMD